MIFERYEGLSFCYALCAVLDVELRCYGLCFLVNIVNDFFARLFVGCRYTVLYTFFVLRFVELVEVSCFVRGDKGFRRVFDSLYVVI